jgi:hypothetical protein
LSFSKLRAAAHTDNLWLLTEIGILKRKIKPEDLGVHRALVTSGMQYAEQTCMTGELVTC